MNSHVLHTSSQLPRVEIHFTSLILQIHEVHFLSFRLLASLADSAVAVLWQMSDARDR